MNEKNPKKFTKEEVIKESLKYFNGDELAADVWANKYSFKDKLNYYESSPNDMHWRMAEEFSRIENKYPNPMSDVEIYEYFKDFKYIIPQGRVMAGLGVYNSYRSLSNCLVLPTPKDSYSSIMYVDTMLVNSAKRGCGYGIDLSKLRPKNFSVKNAANTSTGILPFMERYSNSTREVGQDSRRGACLLGLDIDHPQSMDFVKSKLDRTKVTGANISLKISNGFFQKVKNNDNFDLKFNGEVFKTVNALDYWKEIVGVIRDSSEPGVFFWDKINNYDPVSAYEEHKIILSNACGEQPMGELDTCRLIAINLYSFIEKPFTDDAFFNVDKFIDVVKKTIRMGDDLVDLEIEYVDRIINKIKSDPEPDIEKSIELNLWNNVRDKAVRGRRVGCGLTGLADMIAGLNMKYGSDESLVFVDKMMNIKLKSELEETIKLAKERNPFPDYCFDLEYPNNKPYNEFYGFINDEYPDLIKEMKKYGRRNINWGTIAPVGTTSILTKTSSGCEPVFNIYYKRRKKTDTQTEHTIKDNNGDLWLEYKVFHPKFVEWFKINYFNKLIGDGEMDSPLQWLSHCHPKLLDKYIKESPYYLSTANDINWLNRVKLQSILQKYTTSAISSTINLPEDVTTQVINDIYLHAFDLGCKGITIYREGSRDGILINDKKKELNDFVENHAPKRPKRLRGEIHRFQNNHEKWIAVVGLKDERPYEIFTGKLLNGLSYLPNNIKECEVVKNVFEVEEEGKIIKKKRYDIEYVDNDGNKQIHTNLNHTFNPEFWNYAKLISGILRHGMPLIYLGNLIESLNFRDDNINTWKNGVGRVIKKYIKDGAKSKGSCLECGGTEFVFQEGCMKCSSCNWSKC